MSAFWMFELQPTEVPGSNDFQSNPLMRQCDSVSQSRLGGASRRALRVLVVDDEHDKTDALFWRVRRWGHAAQLAYDGLAGLRAAAVQHPDVVLLDLEMPLVDGYQVAKQLRLDFAREDCFIIAVTERADQQRRQRCREVGIDLVLVKPVAPEVVETLLMLESALVNRQRPVNSLASTVFSQFIRKKLSATGKDGAAKARSFHRVAGAVSGQQRRNGHETGGSSC
jgi:DNA-binding response OmpR family regulator